MRGAMIRNTRALAALRMPRRQAATLRAVPSEAEASCYEELAKDCNRITCTVKMDWRKGHTGRLQSKVNAVEQRLGRTLKT